MTVNTTTSVFPMCYVSMLKTTRQEDNLIRRLRSLRNGRVMVEVKDGAPVAIVEKVDEKREVL